MSSDSAASTDFQQIVKNALSLPVDQRVELAQRIWESVETPPGCHDDESLNDLLERRDLELNQGDVTGVEHEEAMRLAREQLQQRQCK